MKHLKNSVLIYITFSEEGGSDLIVMFWAFTKWFHLLFKNIRNKVGYPLRCILQESYRYSNGAVGKILLKKNKCPWTSMPEKWWSIEVGTTTDGVRGFDSSPRKSEWKNGSASSAWQSGMETDSSLPLTPWHCLAARKQVFSPF